MAGGFHEGFVAADGFRIRHLEAGEGVALVHLHGAALPLFRMVQTVGSRVLSPRRCETGRGQAGAPPR